MINTYLLSRLLVITLVATLFSCNTNDDFVFDTSKSEENIASSPNPEYTPIGYLAPLNIPDSIKLNYGDIFTSKLPEEYSSQNVAFDFDFSEADLAITEEKKLGEVLQKAIYVDTLAHILQIESEKMYPNAFKSSENSIRLPEAYTVTLTANADPDYKPVSKTFYVKVAPAAIEIEGLDNTSEIPFAYAMYGEEETLSYRLSAPGLALANTNWKLHQNGRPDQKIEIDENKVTFLEDAGDPDQEAEWTYDLVSSLEKDGFTIARRQFRVRFIPEIKFLFGMFYPDLDLTISTNRLHIALHDEFTSSEPQVYPSKYKDTFSISEITKNGVIFNNEESIISINSETGQINVAHNHSLTEGEYEITVNAVTTTGLEFETTLVLVMEETSENSHSH